MDFSIRPCDPDEALDILQDRTVYEQIGIIATRLKGTFEWWMISDKALLCLKPEGNDVEVHIACKRKDRAGLRKHLNQAIEWLKERGFEKIYTTAPDERKALINMLKSLEFINIDGRWVR